MRNKMFKSGRGGRFGFAGAFGSDFGGPEGGVDPRDLREALMAQALLGGRHAGRHGGRGRFAQGDGGREGPGGFGRDFGGFGGGFGGGGFGGGREGPRGGGPRDGGPRGGRRKRLFDQAELHALLLALIAEQPRHGYDLIREIEALSGGDYAPSPGVVYPALTYMEDAGLIAPVANEGARKAFEVTEQGRAKVEEDVAQVSALKERLGALAAQRDRVDPAPVRRAIHALRTAMFDRLSQEGADRALILEVADAIDEATRKIERIER